MKKIIPVLRDESKHYFSEHGFPTLVRAGFTSFNTTQLRPGKRFSLLGISQTEALLETGLLDCTDAIDPNVSLAGMLLRFSKEGETGLLYYHDTEATPLANFVAKPEGNYRVIQLNYRTQLDLSLGGKALSIGIQAGGSVNLELGDTEAYFTVIADGDTDYEIKVVGYDLNAYRVNYNRRPREELRQHPHDKA
jgi:hypothetical protein